MVLGMKNLDSPSNFASSSSHMPANLPPFFYEFLVRQRQLLAEYAAELAKFSNRPLGFSPGQKMLYGRVSFPNKNVGIGTIKSVRRGGPTKKTTSTSTNRKSTSAGVNNNNSPLPLTVFDVSEPVTCTDIPPRQSPIPIYCENLQEQRLPHHHHQYCSSPFTSTNDLSSSSPVMLASSSYISVNNDVITNQQQQQAKVRLTPPPHSQQQQPNAFLLELSPSAQRRKGREPRSIRQRLDTSLAAAASAMNEQMPLEHLEHTVSSVLPDSIVESQDFVSYLREYLEDFDRELGYEQRQKMDTVERERGNGIQEQAEADDQQQQPISRPIDGESKQIGRGKNDNIAETSETPVANFNLIANGEMEAPSASNCLTTSKRGEMITTNSFPSSPTMPMPMQTPQVQNSRKRQRRSHGENGKTTKRISIQRIGQPAIPSTSSYSNGPIHPADLANKSLVYHSIGHKRPLWAGKKNIQKSPFHLDHIQPENGQQNLEESKAKHGANREAEDQRQPEEWENSSACNATDLRRKPERKIVIDEDEPSEDGNDDDIEKEERECHQIVHEIGRQEGGTINQIPLMLMQFDEGQMEIMDQGKVRLLTPSPIKAPFSIQSSPSISLYETPNKESQFASPYKQAALMISPKLVSQRVLVRTMPRGAQIIARKGKRENRVPMPKTPNPSENGDDEEEIQPLGDDEQTKPTLSGDQTTFETAMKESPENIEERCKEDDNNPQELQIGQIDMDLINRILNFVHQSS